MSKLSEEYITKLSNSGATFFSKAILFKFKSMVILSTISLELLVIRIVFCSQPYNSKLNTATIFNKKFFTYKLVGIR